MFRTPYQESSRSCSPRLLRNAIRPRPAWRAIFAAALLNGTASTSIREFPLGEHDTPDRLLIPEKLYGRQREVETLLASFDRVVKSGTPELVLVSGYSGIGKSSVVNELHKVLVPPRGLFASGKVRSVQAGHPLFHARASLSEPHPGPSQQERGRVEQLARGAS